MRRVRWEVAPAGALSWTVRRAGMIVATRFFKYRAVEHAVSECKFELEAHGLLAELTIKGRDGRIQDKRTYGRDPESIKG